MAANPVPPSPTPQQQELAQHIRAQHDALLEAMQDLEAALTAAAPGREHAWNQRVREELREVADLLVEHARTHDAPDGLESMIDATRPTLLRRAEHLRHEHANLIQQARLLQRQVEQYGEGEVPDFRDIRQRATWLLNALRHHQTVKTDLIFESFFTDLGTGD